MKPEKAAPVTRTTLRTFGPVSADSLRRDGRPNLSRKTKFTGANEDGEKFIFLVQLTTTSRIGNLIQLIHTLL